MDFDLDIAGVAAVEELGEHLVERLAHQIANDIRRNCPGGPSGDLARSVQETKTRVYIGTDHWHPHEYGSPPHEIRANGKKALVWPGADHPVGKVHHPGTAESAMMRHALYTQNHLPS